MSEESSKEKREDTKEVAELSKIDGADIEKSETESTADEKDGIENPEKFAKVVAGVIAQEFSGPIPPPNIIAGYEDVLPGTADRIIRMAEQQSKHRQTIQLLETKAEVRDSFLGVIFAFGLGIGCLVACIITVIMVPQSAGAISGAALGVTGIGSIVAAFLKNTRPSSK